MEKKVGIMQPYFFPYLAYWQLINYVDVYVIYDNVNFIKNGWINRNNILLNGKKHIVTLPLEGASPFLHINQINFSSDIKQREKILKTLTYAYKKAPYFSLIYPMVERMIMGGTVNIAEALTNSINDICSYLDITTTILLSSQLKIDNTLKGEDKVIHICKLLEADRYINAIGGQKLYSSQTFQQNNIKLSFLKMKDISYLQYNNDFVPCLSILDVLMFNAKEKLQMMLKQFDLVE